MTHHCLGVLRSYRIESSVLKTMPTQDKFLRDLSLICQNEVGTIAKTFFKSGCYFY